MAPRPLPEPDPEPEIAPPPPEPGTPEWYIGVVRQDALDRASISIRQEQMLREADYYELGLRREIPPEWSLQFSYLADPEYAEYLRLKEKFNDA